MTTLKQHPIAWSVYAIYILGWLWIGYQSFIGFSNYADGQSLGINLLAFVLFGFIPYLVITFLIAEFSAEGARPFYLMQVKLILASAPVVAIIGGVLNALIPTA